MNWNYDFIIAELFVLSVVYIYYGVRPKLPLARLRLYLGVMVLETTVLISDALGAYALNHYADIYLLSYGTNMIYFGSFFLRTFLFFLLSLQILKLDYHRYKHAFYFLYLTTFILELVNLSTPWTGWIFYLDNGMYRRGALYPFTYGQFAVYFLLILILGCVKWNELNRRTRIVVPLIWIILACGYVIRWYFSEYLVANLFYMVVIIIILFNYFDPETYLDPQTGFYNEHAFREIMEEKLENEEYQILACIVRNRKMVHRVYTVSDRTQALRRIGAYLQQITDPCVFYLNGGYLAVLLKKETDAAQIKQQIYSRFHEKWEGKHQQLYLDVGIVTLDDTLEIRSTGELLQNMHAAVKRVEDVNGPGEMSVVEMRRQVQVRRVLDQAIQDGSIELYLQPIITSDTRKVVGAEALARLWDRELGLISPGEFIPYAEENGSIAELGMQIFRKVCVFLSSHQDSAALEWINVNLSPIQCLDRGLPDKFRLILEAYQVDASMIHLEITEEVFVDSLQVREMIEQLREVGFEIALDDFGSGYANLERLITYPLKVVKLDRSMIAGYFENPNPVLGSIISTLNSAGYRIVAEGVEKGYMMEQLHRMGCSYVQGFYFSGPIPEKEFRDRYVRARQYATETNRR